MPGFHSVCYGSAWALALEEVSLGAARMRSSSGQEGKQWSQAPRFSLSAFADSAVEIRAMLKGRQLLPALPIARGCQPVVQGPKAIDKSGCQRLWAMVSTPTANPETRKGIRKHLLNFNTLTAAIYKPCLKFRCSTKQSKQKTTEAN